MLTYFHFTKGSWRFDLPHRASAINGLFPLIAYIAMWQTNLWMREIVHRTTDHAHFSFNHGSMLGGSIPPWHSVPNWCSFVHMGFLKVKPLINKPCLLYYTKISILMSIDPFCLRWPDLSCTACLISIQWICGSMGTWGHLWPLSPPYSCTVQVITGKDCYIGRCAASLSINPFLYSTKVKLLLTLGFIAYCLENGDQYLSLYWLTFSVAIE